MDNVAKLKKDIEALKKGIDNPSTPENFKDKMRSTMAMLQKQVDEASKGREPKMPPSKKGDEAPKAKKPRGSGKPNPDFAKVQQIAKDLKAKDPSLKHTKAVSMAWEIVRGGGAPKKEAPKKEAPKKEAPKPTPKSRAKDLKERVKRNTTSKDRDGVRYAKPVGKRVSKEGNTYYEYRENRTDSNIGKRSYKKPRLFGDGGMMHGGEHYADGGRVSDMADYIAKYDIKSIEVEMDGKKVTLEGSQLLDGIYVKKGSFMAGGMTYKRGGNTGNYNYKRSWKMDRARVAMKQDYEKYYKRKTK
jgi:hypothetical protein